MHIIVLLAVLLVAVIFLLSRKKKLPPILTVGSLYEREVTQSEFEDLVLKTSETTPVLVDFYAKWCPPCRYLTPLLADMAKEYNGAFLLAKIDTDENPKLKNEFGISAIPTIALFKNGVAVESFTGGKLEHTIRFKLAQHGIMGPESDG